ncbi:MAG: MATE family efflux transporter [Lachnospiraceae bacterium]|nr:MATE family efflux transporter [Lachnospiraceae bacterium]
MNNNESNQFKKMTEEPVEKLLVSLSIPTICSMLVTTLYNIVDTAFVGTLGTSQSAATGVVNGYMTILQAIAFMCGQGAGSIMSRQLGKKEQEDANETASTGFFMSFSLGLIIAIVSFIFMRPLLKTLGSTETIAPYARTYITYILLSAPFFTSSFTLNNLLRYEGKAKLGTVAMVTGAVLNVGFDALLICVFKLGIAGAGIATAIGQTISFAILISMYLREKTVIKMAFSNISRSIKTYFEIVATGFPSLMRQGLNSVATMMLNRYAGVYGDSAVAAMSIVSRLSFFPMAVAIGIGQGFQPISGYNFGAGKKNRVREAFFKALIGAEIALLLFSIPMFIMAPSLVGMLRDDVEVIEIGTRALRLMGIGGMGIPLTMMIEMGFQSSGQKALATFGSSLRSGLVFIPMLVILSKIRGLAGVQEAQPVAFALTFGICLYLLKIYLNKLKDV